MISSIKDAKEKREKNKEKRMAHLMIADYQIVLKTLNLTLDALSHFRKHIPVMEVISTVQTNRTLIEINLKRYEKVLERDEKN